MERTSCIRHRENTRFFIFYEDMLPVCGGDHAKAAAHRVLEARTNARITYLREAGHQGDLKAELLWITMRWEDFVEWSLHVREKSSFQRAVPQIEADGYVRSRYVKINEDNQVLTDPKGRPYVYQTIEDARHDQAVQGNIVKQYRYLYQKVNAHLDRTPGGGGGDGGRHKEEQSGEESAASEGVTSEMAAPPPERAIVARGGNLHSDATQAYDTTRLVKITVVNQKRLQGSSNDQTPPIQMTSPPVDLTSNKNLEESTTEESTNNDRTTTVAPGSGAVVSGVVFEKEETTSPPPEDIWGEEAILALAGQYLSPLPAYINARQRQDNETKWHQAAHAIYESSYFRLLGPDYAILELDDILNFVTHPQSPAWWVQAAPFDVRLWHVANNIVKMAQDMHAAGWIREATDNDDESASSTEIFLEAPRVREEEATRPRDTAPLVRNPAASAAPPVSAEPVGMSEEEVTTLLASIRMTHTQFYPRCVKLGGRDDYRVDISTSPGRTVSLYSEEAWRALLAEWQRALKPSERFAQLLAKQRKAG